ncbi:TetR/AcrR family transcriptional regulator [Paenibacillus sp. J5C_2022]|uniref:TetR/AcrR family transcriptional regulator n=1 Tax=Paenibacillus sp. J5C2022 TaxID=2977129 RepID=UPI0021D3096D|nr:TetR/AcrR family transcriptional regulator [Paenibacillus sp. J5C2022]MCU6712494.1 TetR/AcrR family transcriptional regulator [Paenibacillus sp. J5C2022]
MTRKKRTDMIEETRAKLIDAARAAFGTKGYADTSMDDLTAAVGLTRGALYHHFGDKKGLLGAVAGQIDEEMDERLKAISDGAVSRWDGFTGRCRAYLEMALESEIQRIVLRDAPSVLGGYYSETAQSHCLKTMSVQLRRLMEDGVIAAADSEAMAILINGGLVNAAFCIAHSGDAQTELERAISSLNVLLNGLLIEG